MEIKEEIYELLRSNGCRLTEQKKDILSVLLDNTDKMMSVNDILSKIPVDKNIDSATVYRNVQRFAELGIIESMIDEKGTSRYVIECEDGHHHHMICMSCGRIFNIPCKNNYWEKYAKENGFEEVYHKLEVYGKCENCKK